MWCDQNTANEMPNLSDSPAKSKPQSLLSFLHKSKLSSNDETERPTAGISDQHSSGMYFTSFNIYRLFIMHTKLLYFPKWFLRKLMLLRSKNARGCKAGKSHQIRVGKC